MWHRSRSLLLLQLCNFGWKIRIEMSATNNWISLTAPFFFVNLKIIIHKLRDVESCQSTVSHHTALTQPLRKLTWVNLAPLTSDQNAGYECQTRASDCFNNVTCSAAWVNNLVSWFLLVFFSRRVMNIIKFCSTRYQSNEFWTGFEPVSS